MIGGLKIWAKTWLGRSCIWRFGGSAKHLWRFPNYPGPCYMLINNLLRYAPENRYMHVKINCYYVLCGMIRSRGPECFPRSAFTC